MRTPASLLALAAVVVLAGCADKTGLLVEVTSSDLSVPGDVDALRFVVVSDTGRRVDQTFVLDGTWPHSLSVLPAGPEDSRVAITVSGLRSGTERVRRVVEARFERGTSRRVVVTLSRDCLDRNCAEGLDCVSGMCVGAMMPDGGVDAGGLDAGPMDAGPFDGGPMDGGPRDGGPRDGGPRDGGPRDGGPRDAGPRDAGPRDAGPRDAGRLDAGPPPARTLLFSEYVEGSSFNKALEIYNAGSVAIDLTGCSIQNYANGATTPAASYALTDVLAPGATLVVCNASAGTTLMPLCNRLVAGTALNFNGDDAIALSCDGALVDVIGQIGFDPGTEWGSGNTSTADNTIRRLCTVTTGRTNGMDAFVPATEWSGFATDVFDGLGSRGCP